MYIVWCMLIEEHQNDCFAQQIVHNFLNHIWIYTINFIVLFQWLKKNQKKMQSLDVCKRTSGKIWHRKPTPSTDNGYVYS